MVLSRDARVSPPCVGGNYDTLVFQAMQLERMVLSIATSSFLNLIEQYTHVYASPSLMFVRDEQRSPFNKFIHV